MIVSVVVHIIILKKPFSKKHCDGNVRQFCSCSSILQNCTSFSIPSNSWNSILTIIYIAALLLIGVTPLIEERRSKAAREDVANFYFIFSK